MRILFERFTVSLILLASCTNILAIEIEKGKETLNYRLPKGWELGIHNKTDTVSIKEFVPKGTTVENWDEMATVQVTYGGLSVTPDKYAELMKQLWFTSCPNATFSKTQSKKANGYPSAFWISFCPMVENTRKPETTYFKAIKGNDSFYVFQKAWRRTPTEREESIWLNALGNVFVCDNTIPDRVCN